METKRGGRRTNTVFYELDAFNIESRVTDYTHASICEAPSATYAQPIFEKVHLLLDYHGIIRTR